MSVQQVTIVKADPDLSPKEVVWENIETAIGSHNLQLAMYAVISWLKVGLGSFQDLETRLRENDLPLYIIASDKVPEGLKVLDIETKEPRKYYLFLSLRPKEFAMKELLTYSSSYEENFEKLKNLGMLVSGNVELKEESTESSEEDDVGEIPVTTTNQDKFQKRMHTGKWKIVLKTVDPETILTQDCKKAEENGYKVDAALAGMGPNGEGVMAMQGTHKDTGEKGVISSIGIIIGYKGDKKVIKYVPLDDQTSWHLD